MSSAQEPEVQFAQRLASNEKPIRTKAIKKLRKYINVRSQKEKGGFTGDELLKLWKGLFYCLWMQDKPLLQEELSNQISSLIHSFQHVDGQLSYFESFLQTFKREWTGIDRLRMDKFFQLVRFMFRQTFELLKRKNWDSSVVSRFLELLTAQLLQSGSEAPSGLQFHILDLYMTELATVSSAELTADQNLIFIEPFCKTAAKTKDRVLFGAICNSIFSSIIDQAPFAIEDLMKEIKGAQESDSDSGQASEEDEEEQMATRKPASKKGKQINGKKLNDIEGEDDEEDEDEDDDELPELDDSDMEMPRDENVGPVLQFDYAALANKLFELASRSNTPSHNRQRLYKIIKVLRDLSEGVFPQDEYPEEVSTDEDDDDFGSRRRMKKRRRNREEEEEEEEEAPAAKKKKGKKKKTPTQEEANIDSVKDESKAAAEGTANDGKKKKRKKKKKKKEQVGAADAEENIKTSEQGEIIVQDQSASEETEGAKTESSQEAEKQTSSVKVTERDSADGQPETLLLSDVKTQPSVTVTEETSQQTPDCKEQPEKSLKSKKMKQKLEEEEELQICQSTEISSEAVSEKKKKKKKASQSQTDEAMAESKKGEIRTETPETETETPAKKKKGLKEEVGLKEADGKSELNGASTEADVPVCEENRITDSTTAAKRKKKKKKQQSANEEEEQKVEAVTEGEGEEVDTEVPQDETVVPRKKKTKKRAEQVETTAEAAHENSATPLKKKWKNNKEESEEVEGRAAETETTQVLEAEKPPCETETPAKKKKKKSGKQLVIEAEVDDINDSSRLQVVGSEDAVLPLGESEVLSSSGKLAKKKKRKIPVVFEFEADELEAAALINGLNQEESNEGSDVGGQSTPLAAKKSKKKTKTSSGSDFITFQNKAAVPMPLFFKTKGGPGTPLSSKKKSQTPKSESKKVTFGLKNNKTAEFRKTDRSLLVSPDGSSRVPFDPEQKPKFGVLKSPPTPLSSKVRKTPSSLKKTKLNPLKNTPKRRPSAADFF
ncbi:ribosomal RNA processing protein 1 homolog B-like [Cheilinus undulatus]|uniref:ribosomal RNA processing protein 1 homolog B-like n=1 Tax=Cheilinus undulatus TaxID=241271 RepID=UPI001BD242FE|nr:ribosomal RNA processing protein 1 homolog B-like [Cheilinus undulatus]